MSETAESVAADVTAMRSVVIEIVNLTNDFVLLNPRVHLESGQTHNPPQPTVRPLMTQVCTFTKSSGTTGAVGVLTYDLLEKGSRGQLKETVAIMFSVPFDYNLYTNWFAVGIHEYGLKCNQDLFKKLYYEKNQKEHGFVREEAKGSGITLEGTSVDIKATMSPIGNAIMKVEVWTKVFRKM